MSARGCARIASWFVLAALAARTWTGCCRARRTYPKPGAVSLVRAVRERNRRVRSLRAKLTADQLTSKGRVKLTVFLLASRGGKLRMEATVLDNTVAVFTSDGSVFRSLDMKKHRAYVGPAAACNVARVFGLPLDPDLVVVVLMGGVPILRHDRAQVSWDPCHGRERLRLVSSRTGLVEDIWLRRVRGGWRIEGARVATKGHETLVRIEYRSFRNLGGVWVPRWMRYVQRHPKTDVLLRFKKVELDVAIPEDAFSLPMPPGWPRRELTCPEGTESVFEPEGRWAPRPGPAQGERPPARAAVGSGRPGGPAGSGGAGTAGPESAEGQTRGRPRANPSRDTSQGEGRREP